VKPRGRQAGRGLRVPGRLRWKRAAATVLAVACSALAAVPAAFSQEPQKLFVNDRSGAAVAAEVLEGQARADALALARVPSALEEGCGVALDVVDYHEHALKRGTDSQAVAYLECRTRDGRKIFGVGIDEDIATASVKAVLSAASNG